MPSSGIDTGGETPFGHAVAVVGAERARQLLGQRVAVALPVRGPHEGGDNLDRPLVNPRGLAPEVGDPQVDVELQKVDARGTIGHSNERRAIVGRTIPRTSGAFP